MLEINRKLILLLSLALACGCSKGHHSTEIYFNRCQEMFTGGDCILEEDRTLDLWIDSSSTENIRISSTREELPFEPQPSDGGLFLRLRVPEEATEIRVHVGQTYQPAWRLRIRDLGTAAGKPPLAPEPVESSIDTPNRDPAANGKHKHLLESTVTLVNQYIQENRTHAALKAIEKIAYLDPDASATIYPWPASMYIQYTYTHGEMAQHLGKTREAIRYFHQTKRMAVRFADDEFLFPASESAANSLMVIGQTTQAIELAEETIVQLVNYRSEDETGPILISNLAWLLTKARDFGHETIDPLPYLAEALARASTEDLRATIETNQAFAHVLAGNLAKAKAKLDTTDTSHLTFEDGIAQVEIRARIALSECRPEEALRLYDSLQHILPRVGFFEWQWLMAYGRAKAHLARGDKEKAQLYLERAEGLIDTENRRIPIAYSRASFLDDRHQSTGRLIELLIDEGQLEAAHRVARKARSRSLRSLQRLGLKDRLTPEDQRLLNQLGSKVVHLRAEAETLLEERADAPDLELPELDAKLELLDNQHQQKQDEIQILADQYLPDAGLTPRIPGELAISFYPLSPTDAPNSTEESGWMALAEDDEGIAHHRIHGQSPSASVRHLLERLAGKIQRAQSIRLMPHGLKDVDIHFLPFGDGRILLEYAPVTFSYDLGPVTDIAKKRRNSAIIISDTKVDLSGAREESQLVNSILRKNSFPVALLKGKRATRSAAIKALGSFLHLHFAGHAESAGLNGLDSALILSNASVSWLDILTYSNLHTVALLGCKTSTSEATRTESIGLAQAFLLAGAEAVIATSRKISDKMPAELSKELYRPPLEHLDDLAVRLQRAQLTLRGRYTEKDLGAVRILTR